MEDGKYAKNYKLTPDRHLKGRKFKFVDDLDEDVGISDSKDHKTISYSLNSQTSQLQFRLDVSLKDCLRPGKITTPQSAINWGRLGHAELNFKYVLCNYQ